MPDDELEDQFEDLDAIELHRLRAVQKAKHSMMSYFAARGPTLEFKAKGGTYPSTLIDGQQYPGWPVALDMPCQCGKHLGTCGLCNRNLVQMPFRRLKMAKGLVSNAAVKAWYKEKKFRVGQDALTAINAEVVSLLERAATNCAGAKRKTILPKDFDDTPTE